MRRLRQLRAGWVGNRMKPGSIRGVRMTLKPCKQDLSGRNGMLKYWPM